MISRFIALALLHALTGCSITAGNPEKPGDRMWVEKRYPPAVTGDEEVVLVGKDFGTAGSLFLGSRHAKVIEWSSNKIRFMPPGQTNGSCGAVRAVDGEGRKSNALSLTHGMRDIWLPFSEIPRPRAGHMALWTGREMLVYGRVGNNGGRYNPDTDSWLGINQTGAPAIEHGDAVWTGEEMLVWGGDFGGLRGGRYNVFEDAWRPITTTASPTESGPAVWTGKLMIVWPFAAYDPTSDVWKELPSDRLTGAGSDDGVAFTGKEVLAWKGGTPGYRYNVQTGEVSRMSADNAPRARMKHSALWTGKEFLVWGGYADGVKYLDGGRYDPISDSWRRIEYPDNLTQGTSHAVYGDGKLYVISSSEDSLLIYDLKTGKWSKLLAPQEWQHGAVSAWADGKLIVWGGKSNKSHKASNTGWILDIATEEWTSTDTVLNEPYGGRTLSAMWTGRHFLVSDAFSHETVVYDRMRNQWQPAGRFIPLMGTFAWKGEVYSVGGGSGLAMEPLTGAQRALAEWSLEPSAATSWRYGQSWTGKSLLVWRTDTTSATGYAQVSVYFPDGDRWETKTASSITVPSGPAYWLGNKVIVIGSNRIVGIDPETGSIQELEDDSRPQMNVLATTETEGGVLWYGKIADEAAMFRFDLESESWYRQTGDGVVDYLDDYPPVTVWTGEKWLFVGGGRLTPAEISTPHVLPGKVYDPETDQWSDIHTGCHQVMLHALGATYLKSSVGVWTGKTALFYTPFGGGEYIP